MLSTQHTDVYTDLAGLARLKSQAQKQTPEAIKQVAKQFESVFVGMMLKSMRQAKLAEGILDSNQSEFYRDMYDQQLALHLSGEHGMGLSEVIARQLSPEQSSQVLREQKIADYQRRSRIPQVAKTGRPKAETIQQKLEISNSASIEQPAQPAVELAVKTLEKQTATDDKKEKIQTRLDSSITEKLNNTVQPVISSAQDFVHQLRPYAEKVAGKLGVDANMLLAQAALETGWGKHIIKRADGSSSFNLFNIKADKSWKGEQASVKTLEYRNGVAAKEVAGFRSYASYQESFEDYIKFIQRNPRYKNALKQVGKAEQYMHELHQAGYATDPRYADKVISIYHSKLFDQSAIDSLALKDNSTSGNS